MYLFVVVGVFVSGIAVVSTLYDNKLVVNYI